MKIRNKLLTIVAALVLMASAAVPIALADDDQTVSVEVNDVGQFDARLCNGLAVLASYTGDPEDLEALAAYLEANILEVVNTPLTVQSHPTATVAGLATGTLSICYLDTKSYRAAFHATLSATNFLKTPSGTIASSNFKIVHNYHVLQQQWGAGIGNIGYTTDAPGFPVAQVPAGAEWSVNNSLDAARWVNFGYAGIGTGGSISGVDVELTLPPGTEAGIYYSTVTLSIIPGVQP